MAEKYLRWKLERWACHLVEGWMGMEWRRGQSCSGGGLWGSGEGEGSMC